MRIISQDGNLDFPYNSIALSTGYRGDKEKYYIFANCVNCEQQAQIIASYSSEAKAEKAMEMLRENYMKHIFCQGGAMATANFYVPPFAFIPPKIFRFPKDKDLEV